MSNWTRGFEYVDFMENPSAFQGHLIDTLSTEVPSVSLFVGGGNNYPIIYFTGPEHAVRWLLFLIQQEERRTEHAWDYPEAPPATLD